VAARIGDGEAIEPVIRDPAHDRIIEAAVGEADDPGGESEQVEQADHRQHGKDAEDIGLCLRAPERHQPDGDGDEAGSHQQHQRNAARARRRLVRRNGLAGEVVVGLGGHSRAGAACLQRINARQRAWGPPCLNRTPRCKGSGSERYADSQITAISGTFRVFYPRPALNPRFNRMT